MATRKKTVKKTAHKTTVHRAPAAPKGVIEETWNSTMSALSSAEVEMQKQVKQVGDLLKRNKITPQDAQTAIQDLATRVQHERKKAMKELDTRVTTLQNRVRKERKAAGKMLDEAVKSALVAFNIPSRQEVAELTRKVDELSRKIDGFKAPARRRHATATA